MYNLSENELKTLSRASRILEKMASYETEAFHSAESVKTFFKTKLSSLDHEEFHVAFLNKRNNLIESKMMFKGGIDGCGVYPRAIAKEALNLDACAVILSHNHPSGGVQPSHADERITSLICDVLDLLDIKTLDHIIVGRGEAMSFAEKGMI